MCLQLAQCLDQEEEFYFSKTFNLVTFGLYTLVVLMALGTKKRFPRMEFKINDEKALFKAL